MGLRAKPRLHIFMRCSRPGEYSIERLFAALGREFAADYDVHVLTSPFRSSGLLPRLGTIVWAALRQGQINHVSGDIHYATLLLRKSRTILTVHDSASLKRLRGWKRWIYALFWLRLPMRRSGYVTAISRHAASEIESHAGTARVEVIPNCVLLTPGRPHVREGVPIVLQMGTRENKNLETVARALEGVTCLLRIVGALSQNQVELLSKHGISFEQFERITDGELHKLYSTSDLLVFASTYEGFGLPILEAQSVGLPVVTSAIDPMPDVAGAGALLVDPLDASSIRAAVRRLLDDESLRLRVVEAGRSNASRFHPSIVAAQYAEIYRRILGKP